jgi:hypothetical protein
VTVVLESGTRVAYGREARNPHPAEAIVDVEATSIMLDAAKAAVHEAIVAEAKRAIQAARRRRVRRIRLQVTEGMVQPLAELYQWATEEAAREMERLGVARIGLAESDPADPRLIGPIRPVVARLEFDLRRLEGRIGRDLSDVGGLNEVLGTVPGMAARRLAEIPGALDAASYLVTPSYAMGLEDVYKANADLFGGYLYSASLDGGTCVECRSKDGREYATLEEAEVDLPGFGPNPSCRGGSRCRCRLVPLAPGEGSIRRGSPTPTPPPPPPPPPGPAMSERFTLDYNQFRRKEHAQAALDAIDKTHRLPSGYKVGRKVPIEQKGITKHQGAAYHFNVHLPDPAERITVNVLRDGRGVIAHERLNIAHEVGHYIDHIHMTNFGEAATRAGSWSSRSAMFEARKGTEFTDAYEEAFTAWARAIQASSTYQRLGSVPGSFGTYMRSAEETFARSYAQYVATRSGDADMLRGIRAEVSLRPEFDPYHEDRPGVSPDRYGVGLYAWDEEEFLPIAEAFDRLFAAREMRD